MGSGPQKCTSGGGTAGQTDTYTRGHTHNSHVSEGRYCYVLMGRWGSAELSERRASRPGPQNLKDGDPDLPTDSAAPPSLGEHVLANTDGAKRLLCVLPLTLLSVGFLPSYCLIAAPGAFYTKCVSFCGVGDRGQGTHASQVHRALSRASLHLF